MTHQNRVVYLNNKALINPFISSVKQTLSTIDVSAKRSTVEKSILAVLGAKSISALLASDDPIGYDHLVSELIIDLSKRLAPLKAISSSDLNDKLEQELSNQVKVLTDFSLYSVRKNFKPAHGDELHLFIDVEHKEVYFSLTEANYSPPRAFFGIERMYRVSAYDYDKEDLNEFLEAHKELFRIIINESYIDWDGSNHRGMLTEIGKMAETHLNNLIKYKYLISDSLDNENCLDYSSAAREKTKKLVQKFLDN